MLQLVEYKSVGFFGLELVFKPFLTQTYLILLNLEASLFLNACLELLQYDLLMCNPQTDFCAILLNHLNELLDYEAQHQAE